MSNPEININQGGSGNTQNNTFYCNQVLEAVKQEAIAFNLPPTNVAFFAGRDDDLTEVHQRLQQNQRLAVSAYVKGMGGVGKTELAIQYALKYVLTDYRGGVCWLLTSSDLAIQLRSFVRVQLKETVPDDLDSEELAAYCWQRLAARVANLDGEGRKCLVIIDDVKADYEQAVKPYLPPMDGSFVVLATTRLELGQVMQQYRLEVLKIEAAIALFKSFLAADDQRQLEGDGISNLCEWLGRLPLAIELVGRYLARKRDRTIAKMQERLNQKRLNQEALTDQQRRALQEMTGKLNIIAAFDLSWQELSAGAQQVACGLALFALAPVQWSWIEAVLQEIDPETLENYRDEELLNLHLVERSEQGMYQLHQLIREYFQFQLQQHSEWSSLRQQVASFLLIIAKSIKQTITLEQVAQLAPAIPHLDLLSREMLDHIPNPEDDLVWAFLGIAFYYNGQGLYDSAIPHLENCLKSTESLLGVNHRDVALTMNNLAANYIKTRQDQRSETLLLQCIEIYQNTLREDDAELAPVFNNLASLQKQKGNWSEALYYYQKSLGLIERKWGNQHIKIATIYNNVGGVYESLCDYEQAEIFFVLSLKIKENFLGADHPDVAQSLCNLAGIYRLQNKRIESENFYIQSIKIRESKLGIDHVDVAITLNNLALLYYDWQRYSEAEILLKKSLFIRERQVGADHLDVAQSLNNLASLYYFQRKYGEAEPLYLRSLEIRECQLGADHPDVAQSLLNLASLYHNTQSPTKALTAIQRAISIYTQTLGTAHPTMQAALSWLELIQKAI